MSVFVKLFCILLIVITAPIAKPMENHNTTQVCSKTCEQIPYQIRPSSWYGVEPSFDVESELFLEIPLALFPCPPSDLIVTFCSDLKTQTRVRLSCQDITKLLQKCLEQTSMDLFFQIFSDCKHHLDCPEFKRLCSSRKYYKDRKTDTYDVIPSKRTKMNNTTEATMTSSEPSDSDGHYFFGPTNWHILWVLLILLYILIFVPCFLNFVIKRSIIDKLRGRCQRNKQKPRKTNLEDDEPPLINAIDKDVSTPLGTENSTFIYSRPDSMTGSSIGEEFDFPFADQSAAVSMVSLLIDEQDNR